jgi:tRNA(Ile2) C34 agmatinyltransferase TiaS
VKHHISTYHLEQLLRTAFDIDKDNHCPLCGTQMVSVGQGSPECPPNSITLTMECPTCKRRHASWYAYQAIMTNQIKVVLECY